MNKILYVPVLEIMEKRKEFVDGNYKQASESDKKSEELNREIDTQLANAKDDARGKYLEALYEFKDKKSEVIQNAQDAANSELMKAREELQHVSDDVKNALKGSMDELASDIVEKIIGYKSDIEGFDNEKVDAVLWGDK